MKHLQRLVALFLLLIVPFTHAWADEYADTISIFRNAGESGDFFYNSYGYAVFPTIGKGGIGIGGAYGKGLLYEGGKPTAEVSLSQLTVGFQWGGQAYSEFLFFEDDAALKDFKRGNFELGAQVSAVAVTVGASADAKFNHGVAIFTYAKGGLMYEATVGGQKFKVSDKKF